MSLKEQIQNDLKISVKERNNKSSLVLRSLISVINNKEIELNKRKEGLGDDEIGTITLSEIKKRKESQEQYKKGGRDDLAEEEAGEEKILQKYAPEQLLKNEIEGIVDDIIKKTGASGTQDMGKVMKEVMKEVGNGAGGSVVSAIVREKLQ